MPKALHPTAHVLTVAATGASGALFTRELLLTLDRDDRVQRVNFIASDNALRVFAEELGIKRPQQSCAAAHRRKVREDSGAE